MFIRFILLFINLLPEIFRTLKLKKIIIKEKKNSALTEAKRLRELLKKNLDYVSVSPIEEKIYNFEFVVDDSENKLKIQVYFGKKGIKQVIQGNKATSLYDSVKQLISEPDFLFDNKNEGIPDEYIGSDESGKGDFFGPLVVAAFYTDLSTSQKLKSLGVKDSKELSDTAILEIADKIKRSFPNNYEVIELVPEGYNRQYQLHGKNLNKLLTFTHSRAVEMLLDKHPHVEYVITDKFSSKSLDILTESRFSKVKFVQETKAEKYLGVAAASILARERVVLWFANLKKKGIELPKGASSEVDKTAKYLARKYGKENLYRICKTHFKNFSKI